MPFPVPSVPSTILLSDCPWSVADLGFTDELADHPRRHQRRLPGDRRGGEGSVSCSAGGMDVIVRGGEQAKPVMTSETQGERPDEQLGKGQC